ncbi:urease accessory protein UreD [Tropicimonas sp. IMCC6043]|uniref:urease accessory protein UreD n=1 Tax=Tropicimonas sp. IMCC6043 TaxID=2510645 RepID=UPI00101CAA87|nr:urease accessory protein UreD [Tropicimonas sp. IMCC6043]RYH10627.1 urease accessory protein UreD [Tropicimonas sp. IMCC6043]
MFDHDPADQRLQRARGRAEAAFSLREGKARLSHLHQSGSAKAMLPRGPDDPEVVFLNTAGGLTGGDRMRYRLDLASGTRVTATTQTAERVYAAASGVAEVTCEMTACAGAALDWLPQETILYDRAALARETRIDLASDARLLFCETLVFGRAAMGEKVGTLALLDRREIRRDGRPVMVDTVRMDGQSLAMAGDPAMLGDARAVALVALVAPGAEDALDPIRRLLGQEGVVAFASAWDGRCVVRMMARDAWPLRRLMVALLTQIRGTVPPRVWQI